MPLTSSATKLAAVVQCVMRTSAECRTLHSMQIPKLKSQNPNPRPGIGYNGGASTAAFNWRDEMRPDLARLAIALVASSAVVAAAEAQTTQCVNDAPNPYHMV